MPRKVRKLTDDAVLEIYSSPATVKQLAEKYSISIPTIYNIKNGTGWSNITKHNEKQKSNFID